jgi:hypothetical protein
MLKPGGLFVFTCASTGRAEHGTRRTSPQDSYGTIGNIEQWSDYYKNLTFEDLDKSIDVKKHFSQYASYYHTTSKDLYFWGIKKGKDKTYYIPEYSDCIYVKPINVSWVAATPQELVIKTS